MEQWKDIVGYEEYYQISSYGNVRNKESGRTLVGDTNTLGYRRVWLYKPIKKRFFIHRLVALHFCDGYSDELVVNHKDGIKTNNSADNLEWVTRSENDKHAFRMNLRKKYPCQFKHKVLAYDKNGDLVAEFENVEHCASVLCVARANIYSCCNGRQKSCRGLILMYK